MSRPHVEVVLRPDCAEMRDEARTAQHVVHHRQAESMHWSRVILAGFFGITFFQVVAARLLVMLLESIDVRQAAIMDAE